MGDDGRGRRKSAEARMMKAEPGEKENGSTDEGPATVTVTTGAAIMETRRHVLKFLAL